MKKAQHFPSVRLLAAGFVSMVLLGWLSFNGDAFPPVLLNVRDGYPGNEVSIAVTATISLIILVTLIPVLKQGPQVDRRLAFLLAMFPLFIFGVALLWFARAML